MDKRAMFELLVKIASGTASIDDYFNGQVAIQLKDSYSLDGESITQAKYERLKQTKCICISLVYYDPEDHYPVNDLAIVTD